MKNINNKLLSTFFLFLILIVNGQSRPSVPSPDETSRGIVGPGAPASPIDMYILALGIVAVLFIAFFTKKYTIKKI